MKNKIRAACLNTGFWTHHLDHLATMCYIMDCPLIVDEKKVYETAKKYI